MSNPNPSPETRFQPGVSGNPNGRPKNTLKDYVRARLSEMTDEEKELFLKEIPKSERWRMAEGNPTNEVDANVHGNLVIQVVSYGDNSSTQV